MESVRKLKKLRTTTRASQFFITTEDAEDTENGHFMGNYGVFSVSSASSVVKNILLIVSPTYQKHCDTLDHDLLHCRCAPSRGIHSDANLFGESGGNRAASSRPLLFPGLH